MRSGNRGQVIFIFVLCLLVLLGFAALAIDVGYLLSVRGDLQRSADAGALAGAYVFHDGGWVSGSVPPSLQTKAESRVRVVATRDPVDDAPLPGGAITVTFPAVNRIQVSLQKNVDLFFAGMFGSPEITLTANATALAEPVDQNVQCLVPLALPYPFTDVPPFNQRWDPGESTEPFPAQGRLVRFNVAETPNRSSQIPDYVRNNPGEIFPLSICGDGNSNSRFTQRISTPCYDGCNEINIDDRVDPKRRNNINRTINEMNRLINDDPFASWNSSAKLPVSTDARYSGDNWLFSPRVVRIMLYDPNEARTTGQIRVRRFAGFWVREADHSGSNRYIQGYFVPGSTVGGSSGSPISGPPILIEPSLKTTRLVQ